MSPISDTVPPLPRGGGVGLGGKRGEVGVRGGVWKRRGAWGSVGARVAGGKGGFGALKEIKTRYYDRAPKARDFFEIW